MRRSLFVITLACMLCSLSAAQVLADAYWPVGVQPQDIVRGIYAGQDSGGCCWMGKTGAFFEDIPAGANTLVLTIEIPDYALEGSSKAGITIAIDGRNASSLCCFGTGVHELAFRLPSQTQKAERALITLTSSTSFIPAQRGLGPDTRTLSVLVREVVLENTLTGSRYVDGVDIEAATHDRLLQFLNLLALLAGAMIAIVAFKRRIAWIWAALILSDPFAFSVDVAGTTITLPKIVLLASILWLIPHRKALQPLLRGWAIRILVAAFVIFVFSMLVSDARAVHAGAAVRETLKVVIYALTLVVGYLAYQLDPDEPFLRRIIAITTIVVAAFSLPQVWLGTSEHTFIHGHTFARIAGPLEGPNQLGAFLGMVLPVLLAFVLMRGMTRETGVALALGALALLLTFSRGSVIACGLAVLLVLVLWARPRLQTPVVAILSALLPVLAVSIVFATLHPSATPFGRFLAPPAIDTYNGGLGTRVELWHAAVSMWHAHPAIGVGPGNYELGVSAFAPGVRTHANNYYLQVLAEQGGLGLLAFALLLAASILPFAAIKRHREPLQIAAIAIIFGLAYHQLIDGLLLYVKVGDLYWTLIGVALAASYPHVGHEKEISEITQRA